MRDSYTEAQGPLRVLTDRPLGVPETITHDGARFRYFGKFQLSDSINGTVVCEGESTLLARTTNQPQLLLATGVAIGLGALLVAAAIGIVLSIRRRR